MSPTTRRQSTYGKKLEPYNKTTSNSSENSKEPSTPSSNKHGKNKKDDTVTKIIKRQKIETPKLNITPTVTETPDTILTVTETPKTTQPTPNTMRPTSSTLQNNFIFDDSEVYEMEIDSAKKLHFLHHKDLAPMILYMQRTQQTILVNLHLRLSLTKARTNNSLGLTKLKTM